MSTELLTRRMDLIHTSTLAINTLKMDTSYPAKLSGIVIKVFQAVSDYSNINPETKIEFSGDTNLFFVQNQAGSPVVTIQKQNVFDFAGNKLKNKEYITGDYVLAIIDINNAKIFIHSIQSGSRSDSIYTKDMDYHCNGVNDNTILGGITNILIDLYDYSQDINYDQDEFTYDITNIKRQEIFPNDKFTINIVGKFGIDYSATDFHMGEFNRQNRSTIMKISGTSTTRSDNVSKNNEKDLELIMNWKRCTVPKIKYNSNEIYAAMFNAKLKDKVDGNVVYYDYWTKENTAHFTDSNGEIYGNILPRRLVFMSIEGCLPINITCEYLSLETFGVGIYCETESNKCITLNNCKISILDNQTFCNDHVLSMGDITTNTDFYICGGITYLGSAIDINAFNPSIRINNCKIKNSNDNRDSNLIINSCSNMMINNSDIEDFYNMNDGYKYGFTTVCMDYECYTGCTVSTSEETIQNVNGIFTNKNIDTDNPNEMDMFIYTYLYSSNGGVYVGEHSLVPSNHLYNSSYVVYKDFSDLMGTSTECQCTLDLNNNEFKYNKKLIGSTFSASGFTFGAIKNIPVLWKDDLNQSGINKSKESMGLKTSSTSPITNHYVTTNGTNINLPVNNNGETVYMPKLFINMCKILCVGILYQLHSSTYISNSILKSKMFDSIYGCNPINIISGELTLNNCDCLYDSSIFKLNTVNTGSNGLNNMSFIKLYNSIINTNKTTETITENLQNYYLETDPYLIKNPAVYPKNSPKLNITSTTITLIPDKAFNFIPSMNNSNYITFAPSYGGAGNIVGNNNTTLSFVLCDNTTDSEYGNNLFNPLINPYINVSDSEFKIADASSTSEIYSMGNSEQSSDPLYINNTYGVVVKKGSNIYSSSGTIINDMSNYLTTMPNMTADFNYDNYSQYLNVQKEVKSDGTTFYSNSKTLYSVHIQDINNGNRYIFDKYNDGTFKWATLQPPVDLTNYSTIFSKIDVLEMDHHLDFWYTLAKLNNDTECTFDSTTHQVKYTKSGGTIVNMVDEDPEDHIFICKIYGSDLAHSGYYLHTNFSYTTTYNQFNRFGVVGFKLKNCTLNMSNCKIGGSNHTSMRNSYNMELFTRRSPRICFDFEDAGIYKISNTNASAWATVLWSKLDKDVINNKVSNIDFTSIDLNNNGMCTVQNCNFINYNALRFKQTSEDWIDIVDYPVYDASKNIKILDKGTLDTDNISKTGNRNVSVNNQVFRCAGTTEGGELLTDPFNESVRNANEMPIIFIKNSDNNIVKIINSDIKGNETIIISGTVQFDNTKYLNNNNALMCYVKSGNHTSLDINNCQIILNKDVIYDRYIDNTRLRDINTNVSYEEVCDSKGQDKYNGNIRGFIIDSKALFRFNNNNVLFKSNDFYHLYGISEDTEVSLIHVVNNYTGEDANNILNIESFNKNKIISIFDCPIMNNKMDDSDSTIMNCRKIPDSKNMSIISIYNNNANISSPKMTTVSTNNSCVLNIKDNEFNNITIVNEDDNYYIPVYIKDNEDTIGLPVFRPLNQNRLCAKYNYLHVYPHEEGDETAIGSDTVIVLEEQNRTRDMNLENLSEQYYSDSILRSIYSFDNFTNPYEYKKYFNDTIISKSVNNVINNTGSIGSTSKLKVELYLDNNKLTPGMFRGTNPVTYTGFNTPIVYSNIYIPINIQGNTFINSTNETLNNLYKLYNDQKVSVIRSATIVDINQPNISSDMPTELYNSPVIINNKIVIKDNIFTSNGSKNMTLNMTDFISEDNYITTTNNDDQYGYINIKTRNSVPKYSFDNTLGLTNIYSDIIRCSHIFNKYSKYNSVTDTKGYSIKLNNDINLTHDTYFNTVKMYLNMSNCNNKLVELHPTSDCDNIGFYYPNEKFNFDTLDVSICAKIARGFDTKYILIHSNNTNYMIKSQDLKCIDSFIGMKETECIKITLNQATSNVIYEYDETSDEFTPQEIPTGSIYFISSYDFKLRTENGSDIIYFEVRINTRSHIKYYCNFASLLSCFNKIITYPSDISNILMGPLYTYTYTNNTYTLGSVSNTTDIRLFKMETSNISADIFLLNEYILVSNPEDNSIIRLPKKYSIIVTSGKEYARTANYKPIPISDIQIDNFIYLFKCPHYTDSSLTSKSTSVLTGLYIVSEVQSTYLKIRFSGFTNTYYISNNDYISYSYNLIKKIFNDTLYNTYLFDSIHTSLIPPNTDIYTFNMKDYSDNYPGHSNLNFSYYEDCINDPLDHALINAPISNINIDTINNNCISPTINNTSYDAINTKSILSKYICPDITTSNR